jgi:hypothetical protein
MHHALPNSWEINRLTTYQWFVEGGNNQIKLIGDMVSDYLSQGLSTDLCYSD